MKIVRKFLRLLPFFIIVCFIFCLIANFNQYNNTLTNGTDIHDPIKQNLRYFIGYFTFLPNQVENSDILYTLFVEPFEVYEDSLIVDFIYFSFSICVYELIISIIFLIFDVFNFMIGIASNWLRKGERLNE